MLYSSQRIHQIIQFAFETVSRLPFSSLVYSLTQFHRRPMCLLLFTASFIAILVSRGVLKAPTLALDLFANMYLTGTVIFGGGPVVIPLLRSYVVDPGN